MMTTTMEAPAEAGASPSLGDVLTQVQVESLPTGAVMTTRRGTDYVREESGRFRSPSGRLRSPDFFSNSDMTLTSLPRPAEPVVVDHSEETPSEETPLNTVTLAQYKQRFRTIVYGAQQRAGVHHEPLDSAMRALDVPDPDPYPGMAVCWHDAALRERLPVGTVLTIGSDPRDWEQYGVFAVVRYGDLQRLLGGASQGSLPVAMAESVPGVEAPTFVASESELADIHAFRARAWEIGLKAKRDNSWCSDYENAMALAGITGDTTRGGTPLTAEEVAALPVGAIVRHEDAVGKTAIYRRDDSSNNPARTVRIGGELPGSWARRDMEMVYPGTGTLSVPVRTHGEVASMPVGTVMGEYELSNTIYTKRQDGMWGYGTYWYQPTQFNIRTMKFLVFP